MGRLSFTSYTLPCKLKNLPYREGILLKYKDNHNTYYSEAAPLPGWSLEKLSDVEEKLTKEKLTLSTLIHEESFEKIASFCLSLPSLSFAIQSLILQKKQFAQPFAVPINALLMGSCDEIQKQAEWAYQNGIKTVKVKVGTLTSRETIDTIKFLKDSFTLRIDVNRNWTLDTSESILSHFSTTDFDYIEDPFKDPSLYPAFSYPLALDETVRQYPDLDLTSISYLKAVIFKPTLHGGLYEFEKLRNRLLPHIKIVLSSSFESSLGLSLIAHLHRFYNHFETPIGLDTYRFLEGSFLESSILLEEGLFKVPMNLYVSQNYFR